ncbi:MAG: ankyrin repeat domain-containing protein [Candidatus Thiodiazotropha endolucinida]
MLSDKTSSWMMDNGLDPQIIDGRGKHQDSALILASRRGELNIVRELLDAGAEVNLRNMDGTNALWAACVADSYAIADLLLQRGADIDNQNDNGATVLMYAASNDRTRWVDYLLGAGADIRLCYLDDYSALDLASNIDILRLLRKADMRLIADSEVGC